MPDRDKVIKGFECCVIQGFNCYNCTYGNATTDLSECHDVLLKDALELLKEQEYARCLNCQFRDFGENEVDNWDRCKLHRHNTAPDEYCSWFVGRE